ncbi:MAG: sulfate ABC transporter substrate-binding protein [Solirubrobacterales bacterium]
MNRVRLWNGFGPGASRKPLAWAAALVGIGSLALGLAACGGSDSGSGGGKVDLVAYSTPQQAYEEGIIPAFQATDAGSGVEFSTSFGSSGDQRRAVEAGQPADYVGFSLEPDMTSVVDAGIVAPDWNSNQYKGMVTESVVVMMVRPGNPKGIEDWNDLTGGDVEVIQPNPATSGGAKWNVMAQYGSQVNSGKSEADALQFVADVFANTTVLDDSARDSLQTFSTGKGDVLIGYENEAIQAKDEGIELEIVYPKSETTILIENPAAVTKKAQDPKAAKAFLDFIWSDEGQRKFADYGYRPVNESIAAEYGKEFPTPAELFTIADLGGWEKVDSEFFDDTNGKVTEILRNQGAPLE